MSWIRAANKEILVDEVAPFEELIETTIAQPRLQAFLLEVFAGIALALTLVGVYGVVAYSAARRTKEVRDLSYETVAADIARRDTLDSGRRHDPLVEAADAVHVDTTDLTVERVVDRIMELLP